LPRLIVTPTARIGLERCRQFLASKNPTASRKASQVIKSAFQNLKSHPEFGKPFGSSTELREVLINFGASGYVALYVYDRSSGAILILAFRHQKEAGY
jgi:plasmid stabilization system protein ParE